MDAQALRAEFPVLERIAYLNSGTDGPLPAAAVGGRACRARRRAERHGRTTAHFERRFELQGELRAAYAQAARRSAGRHRADDVDQRRARARARRARPRLRRRDRHLRPGASRACSARCWRRAGAG